MKIKSSVESDGDCTRSEASTLQLASPFSDSKRSYQQYFSSTVEDQDEKAEPQNGGFTLFAQSFDSEVDSRDSDEEAANREYD